LEHECGIDPEFLETKVGIRERRIAGEKEFTANMAATVGNKLINRAGLKAEDIDLLAVCTQTPDYLIPGVAGLVHHRLNLRSSCMSFDISLGCSGYVHSLLIAGNFVRTSPFRRALLITSEQYSKIVDYRDRSTAAVFGDASSASLLEPCDNSLGYIDGEFGTDGKKADRLILPNSGMIKNPGKNNRLFMDGREIYKFAVHRVPESISILLSRTGFRLDQVKYFVFHQANRYMLLELKQRIGIADNQMVIDMENVGNTVSSSIPIALKNLLDRGEVADGDLLILCGFGAGLSWGTILYQHKSSD
jgi:3-oxoacyl-[acyl-carrier-protein] synthase-3